VREWLDLFRNLGDAFLELVGAELDALAEDFRRGGQNAARAALLVAIAFVLAILAWSLFTVALVWGLSLVMRGWLAALLVGAVYALVAIACAVGARSRWRALEPPLDTVRRRWHEQNSWFRQRLLAAAPADEEESP
jgi:Putative Actinobacterial Holin-X, holin superfamily III